MTKFYTIAFALIVFTSGCKTAGKAYEKGNYTQAIELGVKKLQKDPNDAGTKELIKSAYNFEVARHEDAIRVLSNSKNDNRFEQIYSEYAQLQRLYNTIHKYPLVAQQISATDYSEYVATYGDKSADVHQEKAEGYVLEGTKDAYREAYREFSIAYHYRPGDNELKRKMENSYNEALTKVVVVPIQTYTGYNYASSYKMQNFQTEIVRTLSNNMNDGFIRFYSEWEARSKNIEPDQVLELSLNRINIGQPYDYRTEREVSKEVVVKEIVYKPDSVVKQMGTVKARITTTKRVLQSEGDLFITVRDTKGRIIWQDRFTGQHHWQTEFTSYTGDERALTDNDKTLINKQQTPAPSEDQVMDELMRQIQNDLSSRLNSYYRRYR